MSEKNEKTAETVEETAEEIAGVGTYTFKSPTNIDGEEIKEINYDFTVLNGANVRNARAELGKRGYVVSTKLLDECYHAAMFAEAAGITYADVERFGMKDYSAVADIAQAFLYGED